jgi:hypothetical protein
MMLVKVGEIRKKKKAERTALAVNILVGNVLVIDLLILWSWKGSRSRRAADGAMDRMLCSNIKVKSKVTSLGSKQDSAGPNESSEEQLLVILVFLRPAKSDGCGAACWLYCARINNHDTKPRISINMRIGLARSQRMKTGTFPCPMRNEPRYS